MRETGTETETCEDCMGLVAAARQVEPHQGMRVTRLVMQMAFYCTQCGTLWERGPLGWASLTRDS